MGSEGELIFIEGFTKDSNYLTRINCGLGLADNGIQNMRTLLLGLQDKNKNVRNAIEKVIIVKMPISEVVNYFSNEGQLMSLKVTVKELLDKKNYLQLVTMGYLEKLLSTIEEYEESSNAFNKNDNKESDNLKNINSNNPDEEMNNEYYQEEDLKE